MLDVAQISTAVVAAVSPFLPYLLSAAGAAGEKLVEVLAEKGGEAAWTRAQALWGTIAGTVEREPALKSAATLVAAEPTEAAYCSALAIALGKQLEKDPTLATELVKLLRGRDGVQEIIADLGALVEDIEQHLRGAGTQSIEARRNAAVRRVKQQQD